MAKKSENKSGKYLYAIIEGSGDKTYGSCGIASGRVYTISNSKVRAVVSDVPNKRIRPERRHLAAHQDVLKMLMKETTPLPMKFGIIADNENEIQEILSRNLRAFIERLHRVSGKVEMGLRVTWDVPNIFEYFVMTHAELRTARDHLFGTHREPTHDEKIEVGRIFDRFLNEDRETYTEKVEAALSKRASEIKRNSIRSEQEIMNLACLIDRESQVLFETGIFEAAALFDNNFAFDYNGPWAPHNFVEIDIKD